MSLVCLLVVASVLAEATLAEPVVTISQGSLNGTILRSRNDKEFFAFYGIPYAQPPVGKFRFSAPKKPSPWEGIRDATKKSDVCLQPSTFTSRNISFVGSEDCLYLSVFTPQLEPEKPLPVVVYIHGGAFYMGSGDGHGPHFFMDQSLVMVTLNHRHGVLGYLSASNTVIPGNYGLKDQVAALKWVQSNIAHFGGDPNSVTILGQSSGSTCVHLHTLSPSSKGLFHRAIMQSGSALSFWSHYKARHSKNSFKQFANRVNCTQSSAIEVLSCLRNLTAEQLVRSENAFLQEKRIVFKFRPAIESRRVKNAFMVVPPNKLRYQNTSVPWIIGFNSAEGAIEVAFTLRAVHDKKKKIDSQLDKILPYILHYKYAVKKEQISNITATLKRFYFKDGVATENDHQKICDLITDLVFAMPTLHAAHTYPGPKYLYYYDYHTNSTFSLPFLNLPKKINIIGSDHGDEMFKLFTSRRSTQFSLEDRKLSDQMISYWSNFIIKGDPNSEGSPRWNLMQSDAPEFLHISSVKVSMEKDLLLERYEFWKKNILPL